QQSGAPTSNACRRNSHGRTPDESRPAWKLVKTGPPPTALRVNPDASATNARGAVVRPPLRIFYVRLDKLREQGSRIERAELRAHQYRSSQPTPQQEPVCGPPNVSHLIPALLGAQDMRRPLTRQKNPVAAARRSDGANGLVMLRRQAMPRQSRTAARRRRAAA